MGQVVVLLVIAFLIWLVAAEVVYRRRCDREAQQSYRKQMIVLREQSIGLFESMPTYLSCAEKYLDKAEVDFADGAFAPFWDSIENAAKMLGRFDEGVRHIKDNLSRYTETIRWYNKYKLEDTPPQFPLARQSVTKLGVGTATAKRMEAMVRTAQRNFQFATIYEQRKTNQILVAGFTNLEQALDRMTRQITASIDDLAGLVVEELREEASEGAARGRKALEMLDNIQHGRRPSL